LGKVDSRYGLVVSSAKRARQINEYTSTLGLNDALGIPGPQVHTRSQHPLTIAIEELRQGKLDVTFKQPPEKTEDQIGAAGGDGFVSPAGGPGAPEATSVDSGAPEDDEEGAGAA
jgi:DNA-directed RNA polymerase subunit omega